MVQKDSLAGYPSQRVALKLSVNVRIFQGYGPIAVTQLGKQLLRSRLESKFTTGRELALRSFQGPQIGRYRSYVACERSRIYVARSTDRV